MDTTKSNRFPVSLLLLGLIGIGLFVYFSIPKKWEDATQQEEDGSVSLSKDWADAVEKKKEQYEAHDLYMLTAVIDGYFICKHCPDGRFFLKAHEVYRYGTTGIGQTRRGYSDKWLNRHQLNYIHLETGDLTSIKIKEATLIGNYPVLPENFKRPLSSSENAKSYWYRLVLPPGNSSLD